MTIEQAIQEEYARYWKACANRNTKRARIHRRAIDRLRFPYTL
jgi:hypothetical protein